MSQLQDILEPLAAGFRSLGMPEAIVRWGHPLMMGIVVFVMGSVVGLTGWRGRTLAAVNGEAAVQSRTDHRKIAPWMFLFIALGYTGGILSLVMQREPILESPHFWTGSAAIALLASNGLISATKFGGNNPSLRTVHAYVGSIALCVLFLHALLGIKLGLSL